MKIEFIKHSNLLNPDGQSAVYEIGSNSLAPSRGDFVELEGLSGKVVNVRWKLKERSVRPQIQVTLED